jgi:hypothetical protein
MKCRLEDNPYLDSNFQIEFRSIVEIEELRDSLSSMVKYIRMCSEDGEEIPPLIYKITDKKLNTKTK